jgi:sigma-E factor negative regulatory protein RseC
LEQNVRVKEVYDDGTAMVLHVRESACSGDCHKCSGCGAAKETLLIRASNPIGAGRGDMVVIRSESAPVLKAAAMLYMVPMFLFFALFILGDALLRAGTLCGILGFALGIALAVVYDRKVLKKQKPTYTITGYVQGNLMHSEEKGDN